jgi:NADH:ubiquinone oxidoreductase subunit 6 (subunit J)
MRFITLFFILAILIVPSALLQAQGVIPPIEPLPINTTQDVVNIFQRALTFVFQIAGIVAVGVILYAGVMYMTAGDSEERRKTATGWLKWGIVGIVVAILSQTIINIVSSFLTP